MSSGYLANGHNRQRENLPLCLPGDGGLLPAAPLMAAGWDGTPERNAPGFPTQGWVARHEGLSRAPKQPVVILQGAASLKNTPLTIGVHLK